MAQNFQRLMSGFVQSTARIAQTQVRARDKADLAQRGAAGEVTGESETVIDGSVHYFTLDVDSLADDAGWVLL